ncbi:MAG: CotH protein, partial [Acidimicrobiales bacterium]|nr:CotH protein [Acidimicrobiales bacterium]
VAVGALANSGTATTVTFTARTVTNVRVTVNTVKASTLNIGLAELQAWGTAATPPTTTSAPPTTPPPTTAAPTTAAPTTAAPTTAAPTTAAPTTAAPTTAAPTTAAPTTAAPTTAAPTTAAPTTAAPTTAAPTTAAPTTAAPTTTTTTPPPAALTVTNSGTSALWAADFDSTKAGLSADLQVQRIATTLTTEVPVAVWVKLGASKTLDANGNATFTVTDSYEVEHRYRVVITSTAETTPEVKFTAVRESKNTGLPTIYFDTNESGVIDSTDTYLEGRFTMTGGTAFPQCAAIAPALMKAEGRGNYTWTLDKKPYNFSLDKKADLCGLGSNKKWALLANHYDRSLLRTSVTMNVGSMLTNLAWTPKLVPVDVYVNGVYQGSYDLVERVNIAANRVAIDPLTNNQTGANDTAPNITGGYLLEWDFRQSSDHNVMAGVDTGWVGIKDPEDETDGSGITPAQISYVHDYLFAADSAIFGPNFTDPVNGWQKYIDAKSAVDYYIASELTKSLDSNMYSSVYMYKTRDTATTPGKLFMGPLWDYDTSMGDANYPAGQGSPVGWYLRDPNPALQATQTGVTWFNVLNRDPAFQAMVKARWAQIYPQLLTTDAFLANQQSLIAASANANFAKWNINQRLETVQVIKGSWTAESAYLRDWLKQRITWMNTQLS